MASEAWLRLALAPEVGPVLAHRLLDELGGPEAIFSASARRLGAVPGLGPGRLARLLDPAVVGLARAELERVNEAGVTLVTLADSAYPTLLRRLPACPPVLWTKGRLLPTDRLAVAIVGPRNPSAYGRLMAGALCGPLAAQGVALVSGMAYGIDAEAHRAAVEAPGRGRTIAVLGQGLGRPLYPHANAPLAERIVAEERGALLSIFPMATEPAPGLFPQRNEIIAALALGTVIIEASPTSGALITARHALAAGRVVMACPGDATRRSAQGSNRLLAEGAVLIQKAEDVLAALGPELRREMEDLGEGSATGSAATGVDLAGPAAGGDGHAVGFTSDDPLGAELRRLLRAEPLPADTILARCAEAGHPAAAVLERLLTLEIDGQVRQLPGRIYALTPSSAF
ncbi:MAG: DNA-processing protein DprA [bacterium]|nr:DNA-processing protein DprA [bacterium]